MIITQGGAPMSSDETYAVLIFALARPRRTGDIKKMPCVDSEANDVEYQ